MKYIILLLISLSFNAYSQDGKTLRKEIEKAIYYDSDLDTVKTPAWVIGCIDNDSTWVYGFGKIAKNSPIKPDGKTVFEVGGLTKAYTSTVVQLMVKNNILHIDSSINNYLKPTQRFPAGSKITLLQLMTHTSGLPKLPEEMGAEERDKDQPFEFYTEGMLFEFLKSLHTTDLNIGKYLYSHINHAILEKIIVNKGNIGDLTHIENSLSDPERVYAQGYNPGQRAVPMWQYNETYKYSVGLRLSTNEILDFLKSQMGMKNTEFQKYFADTQIPLFHTQLDKITYVSKAWHVIKEKKRPNICIQTGSTNGFSTFVAFVPETKTGVVLLTNSRKIQGRLGMAILRILNYNWRRTQ
jgi:serine-type D-Ala-D-Ala carboxypeptidase/endopeptidase